MDVEEIVTTVSGAVIVKGVVAAAGVIGTMSMRKVANILVKIGTSTIIGATVTFKIKLAVLPSDSTS